MRQAVAALLLGIALAAAAAPLAARLTADMSPTRLLVADDPDEAYRRRLEAEFGTTWDPILLVFRSDTSLVTPSRLRGFAELGERIEALPGVERVVHPANVEIAFGHADSVEIERVLPPDGDPALLAARSALARRHPLLRRRLLSDDARAATAIVDVAELDPAARRGLVEALEALIARASLPGVEILTSGFPVVAVAYERLVESSQARLLPLAALAIAVLLAWLFRAAPAVYLPFAAFVLALLWTGAAMQAAGFVVTLLAGAIPILVLMMAVSSAVHLLSGYADERARGGERGAAMWRTLRVTGVGCAFAAATTSVGFFSLGVSRVNLIREYGVSAGAGVLAALLANLLLVCPLLVLKRRAPRRTLSGPGLRALERGVGLALTHPWRVLAATALVVVASLAGLLRVVNDEYIRGEVRRDHPLERAIRILDERLAGIAPVLVSFEAPPGALLEPGALAAVRALQRAAEAQPEVRHTISYVDYLDDLHRVFHAGEPGAPPPLGSRALVEQYLLLLESGDDNDELSRLLSFDRSRAIVEVRTRDVGNRGQLALQARLRERLADDALPPGVMARVAGRGVVYPKTITRTVDDLVQSYALAFVAIFAMLWAVVRSPRLAALSMLPNVIPTLVALGVMGAAGITLRLGTSVCFAVALGIAVDNTIHFLNRYRHERAGGLEVDAAAVAAVRSVGRAMVVTTLVLVCGFLCYVLSPFRTWRDLGLLTAVALSAALLADLLLLPALVALAERARPVSRA